MCAETINETINVCKYVGHERKSKIIDGDVILQDIKPDILSIVKLGNKVCINQRRAEDGKIRIDGTVDISVIYIADDDINSQRGVSSQIEFSETIDFNGVSEDSVIKLKYELGKLDYKVVNGRKILVKLPIIFDIKAFNNCDINIVKGILDDNNMQTQKIKSVFCGPILKNTTEIEIKENIKLNEGNLPIGEILNCDMNITNKEYKLSYNKILAKADAKIKMVYITDSDKQSIESFETIIPIMGFIDVNGINENNQISIDYDIKSFCIKPSYQDLQANSICVDALIGVISFACEPKETELVTDFYVPSSIIKTESESANVLKNLIDLNNYIDLSQTLVVPELDNTDILSIDGNVNINEKNILNGKVAIAGNVDVNVLYSRNDGRIIENKKLELPFQQVIKVENLNKDMEPIVHLDVESIEYKTVGENQLQVNIKLLVSIIADDEEKINSITNLEISNDNVPIMPSIVVYYVKAGDTLWNIAKMFRNTVDYIKEINELSGDIIYPGQRLLIPRLEINGRVNTLM